MIVHFPVPPGAFVPVAEFQSADDRAEKLKRNIALVSTTGAIALELLAMSREEMTAWVAETDRETLSDAIAFLRRGALAATAASELIETAAARLSMTLRDLDDGAS